MTKREFVSGWAAFVTRMGEMRRRREELRAFTESSMVTWEQFREGLL